MRFAIPGLLLLLLILSSCSNDPPAPTIIKGVISHRSGETIPTGSLIEMRLLDITDEEPRVLDRMQFESQGQIPFSFSFPYQKSMIEKGRRYGLEADINFVTINLYYTLEPFEVLSNGLNTDVAMILVKGPKPN
jgi:uncharacterized lipoprotein YbaY